MIALSNGPSRMALLKKTTAFFHSSNWTMVPYSTETFDFEINHRGFRCFVACIDSKIFNYISSSEIIDRHRENCHQLKIKVGAIHIAVVNFSLPGISFQKAAELGAPMFHADELDEIIKFERFFDVIPDSFTARELLFLQGNVALSVKIAERYQEMGDIQTAINWLRETIADKPSVSIANKKLYEIFSQMGDVESAREVALYALTRNAKHIEFLTIMQQLSQKSGNIEEASEWGRRIEDAKMKAPSFDSIIDRQKANAANYSQLQNAAGRASTPNLAYDTKPGFSLGSKLKTFMGWKKK